MAKYYGYRQQAERLNDRGAGIAIGSNKNIVATGIYNDIATFGKSTLSSAGGVADVFVMRLDN